MIFNHHSQMPAIFQFKNLNVGERKQFGIFLLNVPSVHNIFIQSKVSSGQ